jgi:hypothetical protein
MRDRRAVGALRRPDGCAGRERRQAAGTMACQSRQCPGPPWDDPTRLSAVSKEQRTGPVSIDEAYLKLCDQVQFSVGFDIVSSHICVLAEQPLTHAGLAVIVSPGLTTYFAGSGVSAVGNISYQTQYCVVPSGATVLPLADFATASFSATSGVNNGQTPSLVLSANGIEMKDTWGQTAAPSSATSLANFDACWGYTTVVSCPTP